MKKLFVALMVGALMLAAVAIADPGPGHIRRALLAAPERTDLVLVYEGNSDYLVRVDPRTLRPRGHRLDLRRCSSASAFAPDRARLALGGADGRLCLVAGRKLRLLGVIRVGAREDVMALQWTGSRLVALTLGEGELDGLTVAVVDVRSKKVVARQAIAGTLQ